MGSWGQRVAFLIPEFARGGRVYHRTRVVPQVDEIVVRVAGIPSPGIYPTAGSLTHLSSRASVVGGRRFSPGSVLRVGARDVGRGRAAGGQERANAVCGAT